MDQRRETSNAPEDIVQGTVGPDAPADAAMIRSPADHVRALARDVCLSWNMPETADMMEIHQDGDTIHVEMPCAGEEHRKSTITIDDLLASDLSSNGERAMDLRVRLSETVRLQARAARMPVRDAPAWSLAIPRLFHDLLAASGLPAATLVKHLDAYSGWEPREAGPHIQLSAVAIRSGRILGTIALSGGSSPMSVLSTDDEDGACTVVIHDMQLPGTALVAMEGWDLDRAVAHPEVPQGQGHLIRHVAQRMSCGRTDLHLMLEPDHMWGGDAPTDADVSWRRIREGRRLRLA